MRKMFGYSTNLIQELLNHPSVQALTAFLSIAAAALVGRLMFLAEQARSGKQKFFRWKLLLLEFPIALGMGLIGGGLAEYMDFDGMTAYAIVAALAYLGPQGVESAVQGFINRGKPGNGGSNEGK